MLINDITYGKYEITEPVLLELLQPSSLNRIKNISQFGIPDKYYFKKNFSRYEHCVGVMLLLRILGASVEEQVAGLLHDISQFSFSHISDWVFGDGHKGNESYHDSQHSKFVQTTDIPEILKKHGYSIDRILNEDNFPLLENKLPDICADRIDYSLREVAHNDESDVVSEVLTNLRIKNGQICFENVKSARDFGDAFLNLQTTHWGYAECVTRYSLFSKAFKIAVEKELIRHDDFWNKSEDELLKILINSNEPKILSILKRLEEGDFTEESGEKVYKKFRYVDPLIKSASGLKRLSELDSSYNNALEKSREENLRGVAV